MEILNRVQQAYNNAVEKLSKYISNGLLAIHFLQEVSMFDAHHTVLMSDSVSTYKSIPGFSAVPQDELDSYFIRLSPAALKSSACGVIDFGVFWDGLQETNWSL